MIKAMSRMLLSAALLVFLSGVGMAQTAKPDHPAKTEPPKAEQVKPEHPKADPAKPDHPKAEQKKPEHPKAEQKKPEQPKAEHPK
jgi:hypothetical protein